MYTEAAGIDTMVGLSWLRPQRCLATGPQASARAPHPPHPACPWSQPVGAGPLLTFSSHSREAAFVRRFHKARLPLDTVNYSTVIACNLALVLLKIMPHSRWDAATLLLLDMVAAAALLGLLHGSKETYLRHRNLLVATLHLVHTLVRRSCRCAEPVVVPHLPLPHQAALK